MIRCLVFVLFTCVLSLTFAAPSFANSVLFFAPTRVEVSDEQPVQEIRITNVSDMARSYNLSIENIVMGYEGVTSRVDTFDYSAKRLVRFVPRKFDIPAGGQQIVRVMARFPKEYREVSGEFHAHLQFLENVSRRADLNPTDKIENHARMKAQISFMTAIPLIVSKGEIKTDISMNDLSVSTAKDGRPVINMKLFREGNGQGNALIDVDYIAPDGTEKKAAVRRTAYIYRELDERVNSFILEQMKAGELQSGGQLRVRLYNKNISETEPVDTVLVPVS